MIGRGSADWKKPASSTIRQRSDLRKNFISSAANQIKSFVPRLSWRTSVDLPREDTPRYRAAEGSGQPKRHNLETSAGTIGGRRFDRHRLTIFPFFREGRSLIRRNIFRPTCVKARRSHDDGGGADGSNNHHHRPGSNNLGTSSYSESKDDSIR